MCIYIYAYMYILHVYIYIYRERVCVCVYMYVIHTLRPKRRSNLSCDIHIHTPAKTSSTNFLLHPSFALNQTTLV